MRSPKAGSGFSRVLQATDGDPDGFGSGRFRRFGRVSAYPLPHQVERTILGIKKEHPNWGAPKIRDKLIRDHPMIPTPAASTVRAALDRNGLVKRRKRKRHKAQDSALIGAKQPNGLWCADYKGDFMPGNRNYRYPLTSTAYATRTPVRFQPHTMVRVIVVSIVSRRFAFKPHPRPHVHPDATPQAITTGHPVPKIGELPPWTCTPPPN